MVNWSLLLSYLFRLICILCSISHTTVEYGVGYSTCIIWTKIIHMNHLSCIMELKYACTIQPRASSREFKSCVIGTFYIKKYCHVRKWQLKNVGPFMRWGLIWPWLNLTGSFVIFTLTFQSVYYRLKPPDWAT